MAIIVTNNAVSKLTAALTTSSTSLSITGGTGVKFPSTAGGDEFYLTLINSSNEFEIVKVTTRAGDNMTITRAQEGTVARAFSVGDRVLNAITAAAFNDKATKAEATANSTAISTHIADPTAAHAASAVSYAGSSTLAATDVESALDELSAEKVQKTADTGSAVIPVGTTAQQDATPAVGFIRFNTTLTRYEGYYGATWGELGGGATGSLTDKIFYLNDKVVTQSYAIPANKNAMTAGPITINDGVTVTIPDGSTWTVV